MKYCIAKFIFCSELFWSGDIIGNGWWDLLKYMPCHCENQTKDVTPLLTHWSYIFVALESRLSCTNPSKCCCWLQEVGCFLERIYTPSSASPLYVGSELDHHGTCPWPGTQGCHAISRPSAEGKIWHIFFQVDINDPWCHIFGLNLTQNGQQDNQHMKG